VGEKQNGPFQLSFNASLKIDFRGSRVTSDGGLIVVRELDERLGFGGMSRFWILRAGRNAKKMIKEMLKEMLAWLILNRIWKSKMEIPGKKIQMAWYSHSRHKGVASCFHPCRCPCPPVENLPSYSF
jgi:hypothetical protein